MEIQQLKVENIGCFTDQTFDFSNLTVVFGENRTGKSTLVYVLFFTLFGKHLHKGLNVQDLCRKGESAGTATLFFNKHQSEYKLRRSTVGAPVIYTKLVKDMTWQSIIPENSDTLKKYVSIPPEVASLTSFFREGELIYFLQDIPKYNQTLLQNLIGIDDVLIVRSRFKKAHAMAKDAQKAFFNTIPRKSVDYKNLELSRKKIAELEKEFQTIDTEYKQLLEQKGHSIDPNVFKLLKEQYEEMKKEYGTAVQLKDKLPPIKELEEKKVKLEKELNEKDTIIKCKDELQRQFGSYERKTRDLQLDIERFTQIEKKPICPTCGQLVTKEKVSSLIIDLKKQKSKSEENSKKIEEELKGIQTHEQQKTAIQISLREVIQQINEVYRLNVQIKQLTEQLTKVEKELNKFDNVSNNLKDAENHYNRKKELEAKLIILQNQIIQSRVESQQQEDELARVKEYTKNLHTAERKELLCRIAYEAIDYAVQTLGRRLMEKVRESIRSWTKHFTFLQQFDVEITPGELSPIIHARGYQYKLNQMSKSERIFLYLMLKLAIGDALDHLGVFILDDPADGLDLKRGQLLANLICEVAQKRQIIVTTNNSSFAEMFSEASRINL